MSLVTLLLCHRAFLMRHRLSVYLTGFGMFCVIGSLVFLFIESQAFIQSQLDVLDAKKRVLKKFGNGSAETLDEFMEELRGLGFRGLPNKDGSVKEWRFSDAFYFVTTLLTTVGYGHYAPKTLAGKVICIIFTSVGIPITLVCLACFVDALLRQSESFKVFLFRKYQLVYKPFALRLIHVSTITSFIVLICFIIPGYIFTIVERKWNNIEAIYFCFISLTTVGLGDMVPAMDPDGPNSDLYKMLVSVYLMIGVMLLMFLMALCGDFQRNYKSPYEILPYTIATEKVPINPGSTLNYGSIITHSGKSDSSNSSDSSDSSVKK